MNLYSIGTNLFCDSSIANICLSNPVKSFGVSVNSLNDILSNVIPLSSELILSNLFYYPL